jgi:RHS repeat-associated protein
MAYDPATDLLTRIDYPGGHFFTFEYDAAGRRTRRTDQDGNVENYFYDAAGRLERMTDRTDALIVRYEYDSAGRIGRKTLGNGVYTTYEYDDAGNVTHLVNFRADGTVLSRFDYTYDASGRRDSMTTLEGTYRYGYDPLGQLTSVTYPDGRVVQYAYDAVGNRTQVTDNGVATAYTANALNQYTQVGGATYGFDADGNLISKTENGVTTTYTYDIENHLVGVTTPTDTWTYRYDAFGNRVGATHNGTATTYVIDPTGLGNVAAEYDGSGNLVARYEHGYGLLDRTDAGGHAAYYTFSAIGNTSELTNGAGTVLNSYAYDPFGVSLSKTETVTNPFGYVGEYGVTNEGNGLELMRARYYDGSLARFLQADPPGIPGGLNLYSYTLNSPVTGIDRTGKKREDFDLDGSRRTVSGIPPNKNSPYENLVGGALLVGGILVTLPMDWEALVIAGLTGTLPLVQDTQVETPELPPNSTPSLIPLPPLDPPFHPSPANLPNLIPPPHPFTPTPLPPSGSPNTPQGVLSRVVDEDFLRRRPLA